MFNLKSCSAWLLTCMLLVCGSVQAQESLLTEYSGPLTNEQQQVYNNLLNNESIARVEIAHINPEVLENPMLHFSFFNGDFSKTIERVNIGHTGIQGESWIGTFPEDLGSATLIWYDKGRVQGHIVSVNGNFEIMGQGDGVSFVVEHDISKFEGCGMDDHPQNHIAPDIKELKLDNDLGLPNGMNQSAERVSGDSEALIGVECLIRLILTYTSAAQSTTSSSFGRTMIEHTSLSVADINTNYFQSGVEQRMEIAHLYESATNESTDKDDDKFDYQSNGEGRWDEVHSKRDFYDGDICALIVDNVYPGIAGSAVGFQYNDPNDMFSTNETGAIVGNFTLNHEMGHNRGCRHDTDGNTTPFSYGHGYSQGSIFRTVMAVLSSVPRVNYMSNPSVIFPGGGGAMGVTGDSDNELALDVGDFSVARHRQTPSTFSTGLTLGGDELLNMYTTGLLTSTNDIPSTSTFEMKSQSQVQLNPGFHAMAGSSGRVHIISPCTASYSRLADETEDEPWAEDENLLTISDMDLYPNPADRQSQLVFDLPSAGNVFAAVYDIDGKEVQVLFNGEMAQGQQSFTIRTSEFAAGTYYVNVSSDSFVKTTKLTVAH